ncbi:hypothetical protein R3P38DRAFT_3185710 [Favolaschia claudopus]|uniref:Uncharacterized protein n=1 Tax=Favolaschia claudopus TaxID=2862362 RepID=A0AAW0C569_9AGAR
MVSSCPSLLPTPTNDTSASPIHHPSSYTHPPPLEPPRLTPLPHPHAPACLSNPPHCTQLAFKTPTSPSPASFPSHFSITPPTLNSHLPRPSPADAIIHVPGADPTRMPPSTSLDPDCRHSAVPTNTVNLRVSRFNSTPTVLPCPTPPPHAPSWTSSSPSTDFFRKRKHLLMTPPPPFAPRTSVIHIPQIQRILKPGGDIAPTSPPSLNFATFFNANATSPSIGAFGPVRARATGIGGRAA